MGTDVFHGFLLKVPKLSYSSKIHCKKRTTQRTNEFKVGITDCRRAWIVKTGRLLLSFLTSFMCLSSVQFSRSVVPNFYNFMDYSTPGFPVHHQFLELTQTHIHWVSDAIQPSSVIPFSFRLQSFPASRFFKWVSSSHQVAKVLESYVLWANDPIPKPQSPHP